MATKGSVEFSICCSTLPWLLHGGSVSEQAALQNPFQVRLTGRSVGTYSKAAYAINPAECLTGWCACFLELVPSQT